VTRLVREPEKTVLVTGENLPSAKAFQRYERSLWGLAYRLTGCAADADDIVQETFLRAIKHAPGGADPPRAWLIRVATHLSLDILRRRRRHSYVGVWLPSPIEGEGDDIAAAEALIDVRHPEARYEMLESVSFAFLVALEALTPRQRAVLLLRDVFGYSAREAGEVVGMSEPNVRITHHRARRAMRDYDRNRCIPTRALQDRTRRALAKLLRCLNAQDASHLERLFAESVRIVTDGGGEFTALHGPLIGRRRTMNLLLRVAQRRGPSAATELRTLNGLPAIRIQYSDGRPKAAPRVVLRAELDADGKIRELHSILASRKLTAVRFSPPPRSP
jgi:RNA polymerase sigma-70 factor (ECF subfamily)